MSDPPRAATVASLFAEALGAAGPPLAALGIAGAAALVAWRYGVRSDAAPAAWLALSLCAAPYAWSYDWLLLIVPLALAVSALHPARPRAAVLLTLIGGALLVLVAPALYAVAVARGRETLGALVPLATTLAILALTWSAVPRRRAGPKRSGPSPATTP